MKHITIHRGLLLSILFALFLLLPTVAKAEQQYVITNNGGLFLTRDGLSGIKTTSSMNPETGIWIADGTIGNKDSKQRLYQIINGIKYYLVANGNTISVSTTPSDDDYWFLFNGSNALSTYNSDSEQNIDISNGAFVLSNYNNNQPTNWNVVLWSISNVQEFKEQSSIEGPTLYCNNGTVIENVGGSISLTYTISGTYTPAYYSYDNGTQTLFYFEGCNGPYNAPQSIIAQNIVPTFTLSGDGSDNASITLQGQQAILSYNTESQNDKTVIVTATWENINKSATCTVTLKGTGGSGGGNEGGGNTGGNEGTEPETPTSSLAGTYYIRNAHYFDNEQKTSNNNTVILDGRYYLYPSNNDGNNVKIENIDLNDNSAKWRIIDAGNGFYQIQNVESNRYLLVEQNTTADSNWECAYLGESATQENGDVKFSYFKIDEYNGAYYILPKVIADNNEKASLNPGNGGVNNIHLYDYTVTNTARWFLDDAEKECRMFQFTNGNQNLAISGSNVVSQNNPMNPETAVWYSVGALDELSNGNPNRCKLFIFLNATKYYLGVNGTELRLTENENEAGEFFLYNCNPNNQNRGLLSIVINNTTYGIRFDNNRFILQAYNNNQPADNQIRTYRITNLDKHLAVINTPSLSVEGNSITMDVNTTKNLIVEGVTYTPEYYSYVSSQDNNRHYYCAENNSDNQPNTKNYINRGWGMSGDGSSNIDLYNTQSTGATVYYKSMANTTTTVTISVNFEHPYNSDVKFTAQRQLILKSTNQAESIVAGEYYIRNKSRQYGENNPDAGDFYLYPSVKDGNTYLKIAEKADDAVWELIRDGNYYRIRQKSSGRYIVFDNSFIENNELKWSYHSVYLAQDNVGSDDYSLFRIEKVTTDNGIDYSCIVPKVVENLNGNYNKSFNPMSWGSDDLFLNDYLSDAGFDDGSLWAFEPASTTQDVLLPGVYYIRNANNYYNYSYQNSAVVVDGKMYMYPTDNSNLVRLVERRNVTDNAKWTIIKSGEYYKIRNNNNQWLTVKEGAADSNWENVYLANSDTEEGSVDYTLFKIGKHTDGTYYIIPKTAYESTNESHRDMSLNPGGGGIYNLHLLSYTSDLTARWIFETNLESVSSSSATMYAFTAGVQNFFGVDKTNRITTKIPAPMNPEYGIWYCDGKMGNDADHAQILYVYIDNVKYYLAVTRENNDSPYTFKLTSNINEAHYFFLSNPDGNKDNVGVLSLRIGDSYYGIVPNYSGSTYALKSYNGTPSNEDVIGCEVTNLVRNDISMGFPSLAPQNSTLSSVGATQTLTVSGAIYTPAHYKYNSSIPANTDLYYYEEITDAQTAPTSFPMKGANWNLSSTANATITSSNDNSATVTYSTESSKQVTLQVKVSYPNYNNSTATANITLLATGSGGGGDDTGATATATRYAFTLDGNTFLGVSGYNVTANHAPMNPETSAWSCDAAFGDKNSPQPLYVVIEGKKYYLAVNGTSFTLTEDVNNAGKFYLNNNVLSTTINGTEYGIVNNNGSYLLEANSSNTAVQTRTITNIQLNAAQIGTEPSIELTIGSSNLATLWSSIQLELRGGTAIPAHYTYNSSHSGNNTLYYYENAASDVSAPQAVVLNNAQWQVSENAQKYLSVQQWGHGAYIQYAVESANNVEYSVTVTFLGVDGVSATYSGLTISGTGTEGEGNAGGNGGGESGGGTGGGNEPEEDDDIVIDKEDTYCAPAGRYVIQSDGYYLARENGNIVATQTFNPNTCIWTATKENQNGNDYLKFNNNGDLNIDGNYLWRVTSQSEGMIQQMYNTDNYLHYHAHENRWIVGDEPDGCATLIESENNVQEQNAYPQIGTNEEMPFNELRSYKINITQKATRIPAYTVYNLVDGTHIYWVQNENKAYKTTPSSAVFTYEWSVPDNVNGFVTIDENGILHYRTSVETDRYVTVTLVARRADDNGNIQETRTATMEVSFANAAENVTAKSEDKYYFIHNFENSDYVIYPSDDKYNGTFDLVKTRQKTEVSLANAVWIVRKFDEEYVQIIHEQTGRYLITHNNSREENTSVHLSDSYTDINSTLFEIGEYPTNGKIPYYIRPINAESYYDNNVKIEMGLNPYNGNGNNLSLYMYYDTQRKGFAASLWLLQAAKADKPVITTDGDNITIVCDTKGSTIYFTTDGSEPTTSSRKYDGTFPLGLNNTIKAIAVAEGYVQSDMAMEEFHRISSLDRIPQDGATGYYILMNDIDASAYVTRTNFTGVLDGNYHTIKNLQQPLFRNAVDATIKNLRLDDVSINQPTGNVGAIVCNASGRTLIYNCGVLATNGSIITGGSNVGSIAGQIEGRTKVVNCYSYATVQGPTVAGIVGSNTATASTVNNITTMIMNCMFYGDLEGTVQVSPIYGGTEISNRNNLNTYSYYKVFDDNGQIKYDVTHNNSVMPITEDRYLNRFEFYRNILNSQRELASYYAFESLLLADEIGKWVLNTDIAPYPIIIQQEYNTRKTLDREIPVTADEFSGGQLRTVKATFIINGKEYVVEDMPVTDMDTARWDYTYGKIVLPHANEFDGWKPIEEAYPDNAYSYIVSGWRVVKVDGISTINQTTDFDFTNPNNKAKDIYNISGSGASYNPYIYAQGGNYVVPDDAKELVFEAHWAKCVYLADVGEDVSYNPNFDQATQIGNRTWEEQVDVIASSSFRDVSYKENWDIWVDPTIYFNNQQTVEIYDNLSHTVEFFCWEKEFKFSMKTKPENCVTLQPGTYMLKMYGFSRYRINETGQPKYHHPNGSPVNFYVKVKDGAVIAQDTLNSVYDHTSQEMNAVRDGYDEFNTAAANTMDGYVNSLTTAIIAYNHGYFLNELQFTIDSPTTVEIGIETTEYLPAWSWVTFRDMKLYKLKEDTFQDRTYDNKKVYHTLSEAMDVLNNSDAEIPADQAIVLVGNYHLNDRIPGNSFADDATKAVTIMSVDKNNDQEPDYCCYTYTSNPENSSRTTTPPMRWDFITAPGLGMAARVSGSSAFPGIGIWHTTGWFETTETYLGLHAEAELNPSEKRDNWISPWIINGGIFNQIIYNYDGEKDLRTNNNGYVRMGGNVYVEKFHPGNHEEKNFNTYLLPVNVSGGEILECYMTGRAGSTDNPQTVGDVKFWSNSGYIHKFLGAYMAPVNGNVTAKINTTIIDEFYGGGSDANQIVTGNIDVTLNNSWIGYYVGGPKVGDMNQETSVTTTATGTLFGNYYGGGYGGTSLSRKTVYDGIHKVEVSISDDLRYPASFANYVGRRLQYDAAHGVAVDYGFEYFFAAGGNGNLISRFFVDYATLSLATVRKVTNTLTDCTIKSDFYGGGRQGYVEGNVTSVLENTTVNGNAFGAGYTGKYINADVATSTHPDYSTYLFELGVITPFGETEYETFTWQKADNMNVPASNEAKKLYTTTDISLMGKVKGDASITVKGTSVIGGNLFGGGNQADVIGTTNVIMPSAESVINGTVYGGGNESNIEGSTDVKITGGTINGDLFGGGNMGAVTESSNVYVGIEE